MESIRHLVTINAPASKVYNAVTEQEGLAGWWTEDVVANPKVGGINEFRFGDRYFNRMHISQLKKDKQVSWICIEGDDEWIDTKISFNLEEKDGKTILKFYHSDWREATDFFDNCNYHWGWYMTSLKEYCENGKGKPFQDR